MMVIYIYHSLSCMKWTPLYQGKVTNWDVPSWFLASILFYNYDQLSSSLMVTFHLCVFFSISSSIKILYQFFNQHIMFKIFHDGNKVLHKQIIYLPLLVLYKSCLYVICIFLWICNCLMVFDTAETTSFLIMT